MDGAAGAASLQGGGGGGRDGGERQSLRRRRSKWGMTSRPSTRAGRTMEARISGA